MPDSAVASRIQRNGVSKAFAVGFGESEEMVETEVEVLEEEKCRNWWQGKFSEDEISVATDDREEDARLSSTPKSKRESMLARPLPELPLAAE